MKVFEQCDETTIRILENGGLSIEQESYGEGGVSIYIPADRINAVMAAIREGVRDHKAAAAGKSAQ